MGIMDSNKVKNAKDFVTNKTSKVFSNEEKSHMTIPVEREIDEKELVNLIASFICSHEGVPVENASVGQEGNNHIAQVWKGITNKKGKVTQVETFTVQFSFMPKACIVSFSTNKGKAERENLKKEVGTDVAVEAGLIGIASLSAMVATGVATIALSPLAIAAIPVAGVAVTAKALSANGKAKESRKLKDEVYALICDYLGYVPDTQTEGIEAENINTEENKTAETVAQTCECGYVFTQKMQFCPECGKKVVEPVEKRCECGNVISEGTKFCPQCGKSVEAVTEI